MLGIKVRLRNVFAKLSNEQAYGCYHALAMWADNELTRNDLEEDEIRSLVAYINEVDEVVQMLTAEFASYADDLEGGKSGS